MGAIDPYVVRSADLLKYFDAYCVKHSKRFPNDKTPFEPGPRSYGAMRYLADQMIGGTVRSNYNKLERIRKGKGETVSLHIADQILTAMGDIHLLGNEIPVYTRNEYVAA